MYYSATKQKSKILLVLPKTQKTFVFGNITFKFEFIFYYIIFYPSSFLWKCKNFILYLLSNKIFICYSI